MKEEGRRNGGMKEWRNEGMNEGRRKKEEGMEEEGRRKKEEGMEE
jgi:hypothetical protein